MKAEIVAMTADAIDHAALARGGEILKQGGLVAFPTETVYGLGGNALDPMASPEHQRRFMGQRDVLRITR